jgi:hypothetical protein
VCTRGTGLLLMRLLMRRSISCAPAGDRKRALDTGTGLALTLLAPLRGVTALTLLTPPIHATPLGVEGRGKGERRGAVGEVKADSPP